MLGVAEYPAFPPALKNMIQLLKLKMPTVPVSGDVPSKYPTQFIVVQRVGGTDSANGTINNPRFVFDCYSSDTGGAEELSELLLSVLKSAQFTRYGPVQFRAFSLEGGPQEYDNPAVPGRRRWQFTGTYTMN